MKKNMNHEVKHKRYEAISKQCKALAYCFMLFLSLAACGPSGSSFRIKGEFKDMKAGEVYIYNLADDKARFDTLTIRDGEFVYRGEVSATVPYILVFPNGVEQVIFVGEGQSLEYKATANDLKNYVVQGSDENKLMNKFRQETYTQNPSATLHTARTYITDNAESPVAVYLFEYYFLNSADVSPTEVKAVLNVLKAKQPNNNYLRVIESKLNVADRHAVGAVLPDTLVTKRDRTTLRLWHTSKDYNVIGFWATWAPQGYDVGWRIRNLYSEYKTGSHPIRLAMISLDIERFRWEETVKGDSLSGIEHYCDGLGFESPVAQSIGVTTLPLFILTDSNHKIISTSKTVDELRDALSRFVTAGKNN